MSGLSLWPQHDPTCESESDYVSAAYQRFVDQLIAVPIPWKRGGLHVSCRRLPEHNGMHESFWHAISESPGTGQPRALKMDRCRRVHWIRPMIEEFNSVFPRQGQSISWWESAHNRSSHKRYAIARPNFDYVIFVEERPAYALFITAYPVTRPKRIQKFKKQCEDFHA